MTTASGATGSTVHDLTWKRRRADPQDDRLWAAMLNARRRLTALADARGPADPIVKACNECLKRADQEAAHARFVAWDSLHQLDAEMLTAMTDGEREARWCTMRAEAEEKLKGGWRSQAAECLIQEAARHATHNTPVRLAIVRELHTHLATVSQNTQHKLDLFRTQSLPWLTTLLGLAVAAAAVFSYAVFTTDRLEFLLPWARALVLGIPAGALGGILSMAFSVGRVDLKAKIPEMRLSRLVTLTRPLLGATVAIPILVFVQAGYVKVAGFEGSLAISAFCFLGGFSERWFLGVMERFDAGTK
jgi:hypothetical protein